VKLKVDEAKKKRKKFLDRSIFYSTSTKTLLRLEKFFNGPSELQLRKLQRRLDSGDSFMDSRSALVSRVFIVADAPPRALQTSCRNFCCRLHVLITSAKFCLDDAKRQSRRA
jgi:hypothetical protein